MFATDSTEDHTTATIKLTNNLVKFMAIHSRLHVIYNFADRIYQYTQVESPWFISHINRKLTKEVPIEKFIILSTLR